MRRTLIGLIAAGLVVGSLSGPAIAKGGKGKHVHGSFTATAYPFPKLATWGDPAGLTKPGCTSGEEGVNWVAEPFTSPGKGTLTLTASGFTGDWDIYIFGADNPDLALAKGENAQVDVNNPAGGAPPEEEISFVTTKGQELLLVACNWASPQTSLEVSYGGSFK